MAGSYPDAGNHRMPYDIDGTIAYWGLDSSNAVSGWNHFSPNTISFGTASNLQTINNLNADYWTSAIGSAGANSQRYHVWIFPEPRDITGLFVYLSGSGDVKRISECQYSLDTTNGIDGTWTQFYGSKNDISDPIGSGYGYSIENLYRIGIIAPDAGTVTARSLRFWYSVDFNLLGPTAQLSEVHIYGQINSAYTADRILFMEETTGLEYPALQDWGDVPRGVTLDKEIRIKNNSSTLTANNILLDFEGLYENSHTWHQIKEAGGSFGDTLTIDTLAPGASSALLTVRLSVPEAGDLGLQEARLRATVGAWGLAETAPAGVATVTGTLTAEAP